MSLQLFFERLREKRDALGFTQDVMAAKAGISKRSYCAYEAGETAPSAKLLAALANMGVDVGYLLTGQHTGGASADEPARAVSEGDRTLLANFHAAPAQVQAGVKTALGTFKPAAGGKRRAG
jgi:transcriptional regulator with XRE-family HTH domain